MNTLTADDLRAIFRGLDRIKALTDMLRYAHFDVPASPVYIAAGAEEDIRTRLMRAAIVDVGVEGERK